MSDTWSISLKSLIGIGAGAPSSPSMSKSATGAATFGEDFEGPDGAGTARDCWCDTSFLI